MDAITVNGLPESTTLMLIVDAEVSHMSRLRLWLAAGLIALGAWVLRCRLEERTAGKWLPISEWEPPYFEDVLLWNGLRYVVGVRGEDGRYYAPQEAAPFLATHWAWIDPAPDDEDGEDEA